MPDERRPERYDEHLGDGAYASFDGYNINLAVNHHLNHVICMEPSVVRAFIEYARARGVIK